MRGILLLAWARALGCSAVVAERDTFEDIPNGALGGACTAAGLCDPGLDCVDDVCVQAVDGDGEGEGEPRAPGEGEGEPPATGEGEGEPPATGEGEGEPPAPGGGEGEGEPPAPGEGEGEGEGEIEEPGEGEGEPPVAGEGEGEGEPTPLLPCADDGDACRLENADGLCLGGDCFIVACDPGWFDDDGDDDGGCEWKDPGDTVTLRVDEGGEDVVDRLDGHTYATLERAVGLAQAGDVIEIGRTTVVGSLTSATDRLTLRGQGTRRTVIERGDLALSPVLTITGELVRVEDLTVAAADSVGGILIDGAFGAQLTNVLVDGGAEDDGRGVVGRQLVGIHVVGGERAMLSEVVVTALAGHPPAEEGQCPLPDVTGLRLEGVEDWRVSGVTVEDSVGIQGGVCRGETAGAVVGVAVDGASEGVLWGGAIEGLTGGMG